ncbi:hypothetical protein U9M48_023181 [Paspalum notatum var. saurae]|uniref:Disease resistance R13L4/SHOC-2-like LRR domain-containing protein n=1 Tax=Paspalum notatum var. saurae TaxID=547442 RepID=A0AAQ3TL57_PASNO
MAEAVEETAATPTPTPTPLAPVTETTGDGALVAPEPSLRQELPVPDAAVAGQPQQTTMAEADGQARRAAELPPPAETTAPAHGDQRSQPPEDKAGETKPSAPEKKQPASSRLEEKLQLHAEDDTAGGFPAEPAGQAKERVEGETKASAAGGKEQPRRKQEGGGAPEQASSVEEKEKTVGRRRWRRLRGAVRLLFHRPKGARGHGDKGEEAKTPASGQEELKPPPAEKKPSRKDTSAGAPVSAEPAAREEKKKTARRLWSLLRAAVRLLFHRAKGAAAPGRHGGDHQSTRPSEEKGGDTKAPPAVEGDKEGSKSKRTTDGEKGDETKAEPAAADKRNWPEEEKRLEGILEEAFTRLLAAEYKQLDSTRQKCLLTFSVFDLDSEVKKQAMIYWWVADLDLRLRADNEAVGDEAAPASPGQRRGRTLERVLANFERPPWARKRNRRRTAAPDAGGSDPPSPPGQQGGNKADSDDDAQDVFSKLSDGGFLVPVKNWCSNVIHGCQVNPLAHWMVKWLARGDGFADLDAKGYPEKLPTHSSILCLTADNRPELQKLRVGDNKSLAGTGSGKKPKATNQDSLEKVPSKEVGNKSEALEKAPSQQNQAQDKESAQGLQNIQQPSLEQEQEQHVKQIIELFKGRRVILNIDAHVYPIPESAFTHLAECLVVLQLGRWRSIDDTTYMEVDKLESLNGIDLLKNLRYLGLRGLARLTELPKGVQSLKKLAILDMRGCQNLVKLEGKFTQLKQLTHLDLTECYMLEYIGRGITSLSELQVFKGFVFATGTQGSKANKACRLLDLTKLKKLQKLTISVTTDANVDEGEMEQLKNFTSLRKLTITWGEIPSILEGNQGKVKELEKLLRGWTSFKLPGGLVKLDLRCYPREKLELKAHVNLRKLYLRGGGLKEFSIVGDRSKSIIKTLRLRYLKEFSMTWAKILSELKDVEQVEIVVHKDGKPEKDKKDAQDKWDLAPLNIPYFTLDQHGVWTRDKKEEENNPTKNEVDNDTEKADIKGASGPTEEDSSTNKAASATTAVSKKDNNDVSKEQAAEGKEEQVATPDAAQEQLKQTYTSLEGKEEQVATPDTAQEQLKETHTPLDGKEEQVTTPDTVQEHLKETYPTSTQESTETK